MPKGHHMDSFGSMSTNLNISGYPILEAPERPERIVRTAAEQKANYRSFAKREQALKCATTNAQVHAIRIQQLMERVDIPIRLPEMKDEDAPPPPPDFVRNVVGSSAGAGSAEYHIYRNNRKKEAARLRYMDKMDVKDQADTKFKETNEERTKKHDDSTAKKRNKRQKRKANVKAARDAVKKAKADTKALEPTAAADDSSSSDDSGDGAGDNNDDK